MTTANQKGGFFRTIEVNRDSVSASQTTLIEPILKQAQNYTAQVQRFVTNITPQINTFTTPLLTILPIGAFIFELLCYSLSSAEANFGEDLVEG